MCVDRSDGEVTTYISYDPTTMTVSIQITSKVHEVYNLIRYSTVSWTLCQEICIQPFT